MWPKFLVYSVLISTIAAKGNIFSWDTETIDFFREHKFFDLKLIYCRLLKTDTCPHEFLNFRLFTKFCGNKESLREVANLFNMSLSTLHTSVTKMMQFFAGELAPNMICFPQSLEDKKAIAQEFEKISGFPNVLGCIDGCYISARTPKHKIKSTYCNRHDAVSITMQGICDARLKFLDVFTGIPSKVHDSRILKMSFIGKELRDVCSPNFHLLGDSAYPLREFLLTPYRDYGFLSEEEKNYNLRFCSTRVKIENAFGVLKCRFRQLMRLDFHTVHAMAQFIVSCCVLHNICVEKNDIFEDNSEQLPMEEVNRVTEPERSDQLLELGQIKRNNIKAYLSRLNT